MARLLRTESSRDLEPIIDYNIRSTESNRRSSTYLAAHEFEHSEALRKCAEDINGTEHMIQSAINTIIDILSDLKVPVHKTRLTSEELACSEPIPASFEWVQLPHGVHREDFTSVNVLYRSTRSDVKRFLLAAEGDVHTAAVRIAETVTWKSFTFPIDVRSCRIELQNGQFFQQGNDIDGNPVFYFRNMCLGPWRGDEDAVIAAVLHRLENSLQNFFPSVKCTLIVLMRRPYIDKTHKNAIGDTSTLSRSDRVTTEREFEISGNGSLGGDTTAGGDNGEDKPADQNKSDNSVVASMDPLQYTGNPRLPEDESYFLHTSSPMIRKLVDILLRHYPERLSRALIVPSMGNIAYFRTVVGGRLALASVASSSRTRNKVRFLKSFAELTLYVTKDQLVTIVGGTSPIDPSAFEAR